MDTIYAKKKDARKVKKKKKDSNQIYAYRDYCRFMKLMLEKGFKMTPTVRQLGIHVSSGPE